MATVVSLITLGVAIAAAAVSAYAAYDAAEKQKENLKTQARIREDDARQTRLAGEAAAARQRKKDEARLASFRARAGAAGVVAAEGSSLLAELDYATNAEMEAQHVRYGYTLDARSKGIQAAFLGAQSNQISPAMAAITSAAGSGSSIAGSYFNASQPKGGAGPTSQSGGGLTTGHGLGNTPEGGSRGGPAPAPRYYGN